MVKELVGLVDDRQKSLITEVFYDTETNTINYDISELLDHYNKLLTSNIFFVIKFCITHNLINYEDLKNVIIVEDLAFEEAKLINTWKQNFKNSLFFVGNNIEKILPELRYLQNVTYQYETSIFNHLVKNNYKFTPRIKYQIEIEYKNSTEYLPNQFFKDIYQLFPNIKFSSRRINNMNNDLFEYLILNNYTYYDFSLLNVDHKKLHIKHSKPVETQDIYYTLIETICGIKHLNENLMILDKDKTGETIIADINNFIIFLINQYYDNYNSKISLFNRMKVEYPDLETISPPIYNLLKEKDILVRDKIYKKIIKIKSNYKFVLEIQFWHVLEYIIDYNDNIVELNNCDYYKVLDNDISNEVEIDIELFIDKYYTVNNFGNEIINKQTNQNMEYIINKLPQALTTKLLNLKNNNN